MRPRKPWYRSDRDAWFVQHNGKQVLLAKGKANKADAQAAYHKLMLLGGESPLRAESLPVATICDLFLDFSQARHSKAAFDLYQHFLQAFCDVYGKLNVSDVKPIHVTRWIDGRKSWDGARRHAVVSVKRVFSWGEQQGLIPASPLRTLKVPSMKHRERVLTAEERTLILGSVKDAAFHDFLTAMIGTGCRPSEVAGVTAANMNLELGVWCKRRSNSAARGGVRWSVEKCSA